MQKEDIEKLAQLLALDIQRIMQGKGLEKKKQTTGYMRFLGRGLFVKPMNQIPCLCLRKMTAKPKGKQKCMAGKLTTLLR